VTEEKKGNRINYAYTCEAVGEVTQEVQTRIQGLSGEKLDDLGEALLDFRSQEDLIAWLESAG
jgi:phage-related minor tail protein